MNRELWGPFLYVAVFGITLGGCGPSGGNPNQLPTYNVTARVTLDGKPYNGSQLTMTPVDLASGLPNSGATLAADGTGKFSSYGPEDGIPAGEYRPGFMYDTLNVKPVPQIGPITVKITEAMDGGEVNIDLKSTGKSQGTPLPRP